MRVLFLVLLAGCGGDDKLDDTSAATTVSTGSPTGTAPTTEAPPHWALTDTFLAIAHRGATAVAPENTFEAFEAAFAAGTPVLETDIQRTADGVLVLIHDDTVDRTTDGAGRVQDKTLAELQALDAGYKFTPDGGATYPFRGQGVRIPTLDEALAAFPEAYWDAEIKQISPAIYDEALAAIEAAGAKDRVFIACFDDGQAPEIRAAYPDWVTNFSDGEYAALSTMSADALATYVPPAEIAQIPTWYMTQDFVERAHSKGVKVHIWTVNDAALMEDALDLDVDGIITDEPGLLLPILEARGIEALTL